MSSMALASIVFTCVFGGALLGLALRRILPDPHLSADTRDTVKLGMGLLATMAALVLGLMVASAKGSYETKSTQLTQMAAGIVMLDRAMAHYGPETTDARDLLRRSVVRLIDQTWPGQDAPRRPELNPRATGAEPLYDKLHALSPQSQAQRALQAEALKIGVDLARTRWLLFVQEGSSIPTPFLVIVTFWITVIFVSFGLFGPANAMVVTTLLIVALSVSASIFLILELDDAFRGLLQISSAPLRMALDSLGH